jgi:hypothetical protein
MDAAAENAWDLVEDGANKDTEDSESSSGSYSSVCLEKLGYIFSSLTKRQSLPSRRK